jgi:hypothetical protein
MLKQIYEIINIFSASLPYYAQITKFKQTKNSEGYSLKVSLLILMSSIMRIYFWFGKYFHWSLLMQAIFLIITRKNFKQNSDYINNNTNEFTNTNELVKENDMTFLKSSIDNILLTSKINQKESILDKDLFFNWNQFQFYILFIICYTSLLTFFTEYFGFESIFFVEILGILQTLIEGSMAVPQILEIYNTKNVDNISIALIASWFIGDILKTYYFISSSSPFQFIILGLTQCSLNCVIVYLFLKYKK